MLTILSACRRSEVPGMENSPISLTAGVAGDTPAVTKAVISAGSGLPFAEGTSLYMVLKSEKDNLNPLFSRTIGFTEASVVNFASQYGRFWEDSYSRNSQLSVYAACVPGYYLDASVNEGVTPAGTPDAVTWTVGGSAEYDNTWKADAGSTTLAWPLRSASAGRQTGVFPAGQDLCFSNNVSGDARVTFDNTLKKFGSGKLIFNHALSKITFRIRMGEGFQSQDPYAVVFPVVSRCAADNLNLINTGASLEICLVICETGSDVLTVAEIILDFIIAPVAVRSAVNQAHLVPLSAAVLCKASADAAAGRA